MDEEIERIKDSLRQFVQSIVQRGQPLSDEIRQMLTQALAHAESRITQLRSTQTIPRGTENLWVLAGGNPQAFQSYLQNYPSRELNEIARNTGRVSNIGSRLANRITLPFGQVAGGIPRADLSSSNIYGFSYDPRNSLLKVRFQGGGIYEYDGVPPQIFNTFKQGAIPARTSGSNRYGVWWVGKKPSLGATFFNLIRDRYPYQRVA